MLEQRTEWQVKSITDSKSNHIIEAFGDRYGLTSMETEVLRLLVLFGFEDEEIITIIQCSPDTLDNLLSVLMLKSRTHSTRELQALFLRYVMQQELSA
ncbi:helix-turn-helix transcriptional regulator [Cohnella abietis]|uniref:HTH luxR-type domain-containing protein n=1 Tax=Cohnella abietis TaxID=2507935 RepID=A0A3T1D6Q4_9BACL|nr:hypothetical protein [Cohnella abietis]BBI33755.1 hypothetical protein KCTCHS21_31540 [Cohnella abietis]